MVKLTIANVNGWAQSFYRALRENGISGLMLLNSDGTAEFTITESDYRAACDIWDRVKKG